MKKNKSSMSKQNDEPKELTPKELVQKHMENPNHVITEEELKNVKIGESVKQKELDEKKEELDNLPHNDDLPNPYTVLGE